MHGEINSLYVGEPMTYLAPGTRWAPGYTPGVGWTGSSHSSGSSSASHGTSGGSGSSSSSSGGGSSGSSSRGMSVWNPPNQFGDFGKTITTAAGARQAASKAWHISGSRGGGSSAPKHVSAPSSQNMSTRSHPTKAAVPSGKPIAKPTSAKQTDNSLQGRLKAAAQHSISPAGVAREPYYTDAAGVKYTRSMMKFVNPVQAAALRYASATGKPKPVINEFVIPTKLDTAGNVVGYVPTKGLYGRAAGTGKITKAQELSNAVALPSLVPAGSKPEQILAQGAKGRRDMGIAKLELGKAAAATEKENKLVKKFNENWAGVGTIATGEQAYAYTQARSGLKSELAPIEAERTAHLSKGLAAASIASGEIAAYNKGVKKINQKPTAAQAKARMIAQADIAAQQYDTLDRTFAKGLAWGGTALAFSAPATAAATATTGVGGLAVGGAAFGYGFLGGVGSSIAGSIYKSAWNSPGFDKSPRVVPKDMVLPLPLYLLARTEKAALTHNPKAIPHPGTWPSFEQVYEHGSKNFRIQAPIERMRLGATMAETAGGMGTVMAAPHAVAAAKNLWKAATTAPEPVFARTRGVGTFNTNTRLLKISDITASKVPSQELPIVTKRGSEDVATKFMGVEAPTPASKMLRGEQIARYHTATETLNPAEHTTDLGEGVGVRAGSYHTLTNKGYSFGTFKQAFEETHTAGSYSKLATERGVARGLVQSRLLEGGKAVEVSGIQAGYTRPLKLFGKPQPFMHRFQYILDLTKEEPLPTPSQGGGSVRPLIRPPAGAETDTGQLLAQAQKEVLGHLPAPHPSVSQTPGGAAEITKPAVGTKTAAAAIAAYRLPGASGKGATAAATISGGGDMYSYGGGLMPPVIKAAQPRMAVRQRVGFAIIPQLGTGMAQSMELPPVQEEMQMSLPELGSLGAVDMLTETAPVAVQPEPQQVSEPVPVPIPPEPHPPIPPVDVKPPGAGFVPLPFPGGGGGWNLPIGIGPRRSRKATGLGLTPHYTLLDVFGIEARTGKEAKHPTGKRAMRVFERTLATGEDFTEALFKGGKAKKGKKKKKRGLTFKLF